MTTELTAERLHELLDYNPDTGIFTWLQGKRIGKRAGTLDRGTGYRRVWIDGKLYLEQRLAFLYMMGRFPPAEVEVDHEVGIKDFNAYETIRLATHRQNSRNSRVQRTKPSGLPKGVSPSRTRFRARINVGQRSIFIGSFATPEEAEAAYIAAEREHFGSFARVVGFSS